MKSLFLLTFLIMGAAMASSSLDGTWKITDTGLVKELSGVYTSMKQAANKGDVTTFSKSFHPYRQREQTLSLAQAGMTLNSELLKNMIAPALAELGTPRFLKNTPATAILVTEGFNADQPLPSQRSLTFIEFLRDADSWKVGKISTINSIKDPKLPDDFSLSPSFPELKTVSKPEIVGYYMLRSDGFSGSISVNNSEPITFEPAQNAQDIVPGGFKGRNEFTVVLSDGKPAAQKNFEIIFLTRGDSSMIEQFKKSFDAPGTFKEVFEIKR